MRSVVASGACAALVACVPAVLAGCGGDDDPSTSVDMGRRDAGDGGRRDTGSAEPDMSMEEPDMAMPPLDMGMPPRDMAMPPLDMGMPPLDMGTPPLDMGPPPMDLGPGVMTPSVAGDLIITEILYDPTAVAEEMGEWIELFNPGGDTLFLGGCELADGSAGGTHVIDAAAGLRVGPGESIVLARSATPGFTPDYSYADAFALNNSGMETVTLTCGGVVIDRVVYDTASWPDPTGGSLSLDPSSYDGIANDSPAAWCAATMPFASGDFGSPQQINPACPVVMPDAGPPDMGPVDMGPPDTGPVDMGPPDTGPVDMGPVDMGPVDMGPRDMGPMDMGPMDMGPPGTIPSVAGQLVISEVMYDPSGAEPGTEWVEIHNPSTTVTFNLIGCSIRDNDGPPGHIVGSSVVVAPGAYVTLSRGPGPGFIPSYVYGGGGGVEFTNTSDDVSITCGGTLIDGISYDEGGGWPVAMNAALNLSPGALSAIQNDSPTNWCLATSMFSTGDRGTPGAANTACPMLDAGPMDMGPMDMGADAADMSIPDLGPDVADMNTADVADMNTADVADMNVPDAGPSSPSAAGQLVITEIMYDPTGTEPDNEWFELFNPSASVSYELQGCVLTSGAANHTIGSSIVMDPGTYAVVARTNMVTGLPEVYVYGGSGNIQLGNGSDDIRISCGGTLIDLVAYDEGAAPPADWPPAVSASISLHPTMATLTAAANDDPANWCVSTTATLITDPSTPGMVNMACP
ncbi:MAG: lamin tail domain-containing protein [Deltaproteobacteria bacterium]|nr:lamin tail domain-containing protein [Deltaproteobacteria bacterium]